MTMFWDMSPDQVEDATRRLHTIIHHLNSAKRELEELFDDYVGLYGVNHSIGAVEQTIRTAEALVENIKQ